MFKSYTDYNFQGNQLLNVVIHTADAHPTTPVPTAGQLYYNTVQKALYSYDAVAVKWRKVGSDIASIKPGAGVDLGITTNTETLQQEYTVNVDINTAHLVIESYQSGGATKSRVSIVDAGVTEDKIADGAVKTNKIADSQVTRVKIADKAINFSKMENIVAMSVIGNMTSATGAPAAIKVLTDLNGAVTAADLINAQGVKAYIDSSVASIGTLRGGFDSETETKLPGSDLSNNATKKGDYWYVTKAGTITISGTSEAFNVGDVIIANKNNPTNSFNDYIRLESNRDAATTTTLGLVTLATQADVLAGTGNGVVTSANLHARTATETRTGLVELATTTEAGTGTDTARAVTPAGVKTALDNRSFISTFGDGTAESYTLTHSLGTKNIVVNFYDADGVRVNCGVTTTSVNAITVIAKPAPLATAKITAVIMRAKI